MSVTTLDDHTALIVIDLQKGIVGLPTVHPMDGVLRNATALIEQFRARRLPVVLVNADGGAPGRTQTPPRTTQRPADWAELVAELNQQPDDHLVTKRTWGAFTNTDLNAYLRGKGVTQVVIVGVSTSAGVESTARQAHEHGYHVTLAVDAMTDMNPDAHSNSVERIFPRLGETGSTAELLEKIEQLEMVEPFSPG
ncbi:isochorismatase family protein [Jatrophihabitans sp. GAS493]|uniref:isochorismatase family cysteine hydrolase n=1 Tax=Jatrophihabitans sp. GAS493 TaxID=1907575 RepID=UPI00155F9824